MKARFQFLGLIPILIAALMGPTALMAGPRDQDWDEVKAAMSKGLPKTAAEKLTAIAEAAREEEAYPEAVKAAGWALVLRGQIEGREPALVIADLEGQLDQWPEEAHPVLETLLARWYWNFFQQNRWHFSSRTQTEDSPGEDLMTWSLPQILDEIDTRFEAALARAGVLQAIPIGQWDELLAPGTLPDVYRPTLYDFVAQEALEFYQSGERGGVKAVGEFELMAESPIFASQTEFLAWDLSEEAKDAPLVKAIRLFQSSMRFHVREQHSQAVMEADLGRLQLGMNHAFGEDKEARYLQALERFVEATGNDEISARARALWAQVLQNQGDLVAAHQVASEGMQGFPDTQGGNQCHNLVQSIEAPVLNLQVERVWNDPLPKVRAAYKNLTQVHFRVVNYDHGRLLQGADWNPEQLSRGEVERLAQVEPVKAWRHELPATEDYATTHEGIQVPLDLKPGLYVLLASVEEDFLQEDDNQVSQALFWVSDLALVIRKEQGSGTSGGFVLNAITGEPQARAKVEAFALEQQRRGGNRERRWKSIGQTRTDSEGLFSFGVDGKAQVQFLVTHQEQSISSMRGVANDRYQRRLQETQRVLLFTDRSIYRPGQTIRYKGVALRQDPGKGEYEVMAGTDVEVEFVDVNGQEISRQQHRANDFGSFSGSFQAPRDRLMGRMSLRIQGKGHASVTVEEYKRPKFQVELKAPEEAVKLDEVVTLTGEAQSYTGAPVDGAKVRYRVVREVNYPVWWRIWRAPRQERQEIAQGSTETEIDGSFSVSFPARPDRSANKEGEPSFRFSVSVDVTDSVGETRSADRSIQVGYTAMRATLSADEWQEVEKPVELRIGTQSLDGKGRAAVGTIRVHRLQEPDQVQRAALGGTYWEAEDPGDIARWEAEELVQEAAFETDESGAGTLNLDLPRGIYRAELESDDGFGKRVRARLTMQVLDPESQELGLRIPYRVVAPEWRVEPGSEFSALWGTGYDQGRAYVEIVHRGEHLVREWTDPARTQQLIRQAVSEEMRGGFLLFVTMVRENRAYTTSRKVDVPWTNKGLSVKWERHRSKLEPGAEETWTAVVTGGDSEKAVAEVVAGLYDESLDAFLPHRWTQEIGGFYQDSYPLTIQFQNRVNRLNRFRGRWHRDRRSVSVRLRKFPGELVQFYGGSRTLRKSMMVGRAGALPEAAPMAAVVMDGEPEQALALADAPQEAAPAGGGEEAPPSLDEVPLRTNLEETAFFFPHLVSGEEGSVRMEFTMPEALTSWRFMAFAHDRDLRSGFMESSVVTAKDLMIQPNAPRFVREGDELEFTVKVINQSDRPQAGSVRLSLQDARTLDAVDGKIGNADPEQSFEVPAGESRSYSWRLTIPDGLEVLVYRAVGSSGTLSDGEEGYLPVLPRRILVTESVSLPIRGEGEAEFALEKLLQSGASETLRHESLTLQMVSNPSWYAVMALPYLMEFPHECSEQVFGRYYANTLAQHIARSDPKIRRVFDQWKGTDSLSGALEKNEELKAVLLEETPWVRQAKNETEARQKVGLLFDQNRLREERNRALRKLAEQQLGQGAWPWFAGGRPSEYITLYVVTGFGRLRHLGVSDVEMESALRAVPWLDGEMERRYRRILERKVEEENHLSPHLALYLYGRSFFLEDRPVSPAHQEALGYFLAQARDHWVDLGNRQSQAHLALALTRFGVYEEVPGEIMASLREHALQEEEMGMYWKDGGPSYWWYRAPVETQALMIEAFDEVARDEAAVEDLKVWLLKQKQTQDWKTTKATADAVYALLLRGSDLLASDELVTVTLGGQLVNPDRVEAGTGFFEERFQPGEIRPEQGKVALRKSDPGVAWGSLHWQYLETLEEITPHTDNPLTVGKALYRKVNSDGGPILERVEEGDPLEVGDLLVSRIEIRSDRDMEFLHLKDQRGSGTEPVHVLSRYRHQDGLSYYESTRDTATHYFLEFLPEGTYLLESEMRVVHRGRYQSGMAQIQCMYAPEFNSHSESFSLEVK